MFTDYCEWFSVYYDLFMIQYELFSDFCEIVIIMNYELLSEYYDSSVEMRVRT